MFLRTKEKFELSFGANKIMFRIFRFEIGVAVQIIGKKSHGLHVWEKFCGKRQVFYFRFCEECLSCLKIAFGKSLENVHSEVNFGKIGFVFG